MSVAEKSRVDYGACESMLRFALSATEIGGGSSLADWINAKPSDFVAANWRKPKGQPTHAVATRQGGTNSIPMDEIDWYKTSYVRAINSLPAPFPDMLRGRFSENPTISEKFAVVHPVLGMYRKSEPMMVAKDMIDHIYSPRMVRDNDSNRLRPQKIWERYGFSYVEWENHKDRKTWDDVRRKLRQVVRPAIDAWVAECRRKDLEI